MRTKNIDCIELKRKAQEKIFNEILDKNKAQEIKYFSDRAANGSFSSWLKTISSKAGIKSSTRKIFNKSSEVQTGFKCLEP